jgi:hypothetical protein
MTANNVSKTDARKRRCASLLAPFNADVRRAESQEDADDRSDQTQNY